MNNVGVLTNAQRIGTSLKFISYAGKLFQCVLFLICSRITVNILVMQRRS